MRANPISSSFCSRIRRSDSRSSAAGPLFWEVVVEGEVEVEGEGEGEEVEEEEEGEGEAEGGIVALAILASPSKRKRVGPDSTRPLEVGKEEEEEEEDEEGGREGGGGKIIPLSLSLEFSSVELSQSDASKSAF